MKNIKKKRKLIVIIVLVAVVMFIYNMTFYRNHKLAENKNSKLSFSQIIKKINNDSESINNIELNEQELNKLLNFYIADGINKNGVKVDNAYVELINEDVKVYVNIEYKKLKFQLSTIGKVYCKKDNLVFEPYEFKLGRIPLSKNFVIKNIKKYYKNVDDDKILINKNKIPIKITNIECKNNKLIIELQKSITSQIVDKVKEDLNSISKKAKDSVTKQKVDNAIKNINMKSNDNKSDQKSLIKNSTSINEDQHKNSTNNNVRNNIISDFKDESSDRKNTNLNSSLNKALSELNNTKKLVNSQKQKQMMDIMISTIQKLKQDNTYDYGGNMRKVISIYKELPEKERKKFKNIILTNIDVTNALKVKNSL